MKKMKTVADNVAHLKRYARAHPNARWQFWNNALQCWQTLPKGKQPLWQPHVQYQVRDGMCGVSAEEDKIRDGQREYAAAMAANQGEVTMKTYWEYLRSLKDGTYKWQRMPASYVPLFRPGSLWRTIEEADGVQRVIETKLTLAMPPDIKEKLAKVRAEIVARREEPKNEADPKKKLPDWLHPYVVPKNEADPKKQALDMLAGVLDAFNTSKVLPVEAVGAAILYLRFDTSWNQREELLKKIRDAVRA